MTNPISSAQARQLEVRGDSRQAPIAKNLTAHEAALLIGLQTAERAADLRLEFSERDGFDGEVWRYFGIRSTGQSSSEFQTVSRVNTCSFCYGCNIGFGSSPSYEVAEQLLQVLRELGADCSSIPAPNIATLKVLFIDDSTLTLRYLGDDNHRRPGESKKEAKILLADADLVIGPNTQMQVIESRTCSTVPAHKSDPALCKIIAQMTKTGSVDLVVIGHNQGAGTEKVKAVHQTLRSRIIVTLSKQRKGDTTRDAYTALGVRHFCQLHELRAKVIDLAAQIVRVS